MVITINFSNINYLLNEALLVLLEPKVFLIDKYLCYLRKFWIQFPIDGDLFVHVYKNLVRRAI